VIRNNISIIIGSDKTSIEVETGIGTTVSTVPTSSNIIAWIAKSIVYRVRVYTHGTTISTATTREMIQRT
jgi:hypothetical protein